MRDGCVVDSGGDSVVDGGESDDAGEPVDPLVAPSGPLWVDALTGRRTRLRHRTDAGDADPGDAQRYVGSGP
jgi:hypothetical protein